MVEPYSYNIQNVIQQELFKAAKSIKIAVAWFNNNLLFQPLLMKLQMGVAVEIILNKDDINCSNDNSLNFDEFISLGGVLRWYDSKQLMHDKFCIIDDKIIITGSYNWTYKAEHKNRENINVIRDDETASKKYDIIYKDLISNIEPEKKIIETNTPKTSYKITTTYPETNKVEDSDSKCDESDIQNGITDNLGVTYSPDGKKLLKGANIPSYIVKDGTEVICDNAFENCNAMTSIILPSTLLIIGKCAFTFCSKLLTLTIPQSVNRIKEFAFNHCVNLQNCNILNDNTNIENGIFNMCNSIRFIHLPNKLKFIPENLCSCCSELKNINIPSGVVEIKKQAFAGCRSLTVITLPDCVKTIDEGAFQSCKSLNILTLPQNLTKLGSNPFAGCRRLKISSNSPSYIVDNNIIYSADRQIMISYLCKESSFIINEKVTQIEDYCFAFSQIRSIKMSNNVYKIGCYAFAWCNELVDISLSLSLNKISVGAFNDCQKLEHISLPNSLTTIESFSFDFCKSLKKINIPESVCYIGNNAFQGCGFNDIYLPQSICELKYSPFGHRPMKVYIPKGTFHTLAALIYESCDFSKESFNEEIHTEIIECETNRKWIV